MRVSGKVLDVIARTVPAAIASKFDGGKLYIPFTYLTDEFVEKLMSGAEFTIDEHTFDSRKGRYTLSLKSLSRKGERSMTLSQWLEASQRFLILIAEQTCPEELLMWKRHTARVVEKGIGALWPLWLGYDIAVRYHCTLNSTMDPASEQTALLDEERERFRTEQANDYARGLWEASTASASKGGPSRSAATSSRYSPMGQRPSTTNPPDTFCFRCGRRGSHRTPECDATATVRKQPLTLLGLAASPSAPNSDASGQTYCLQSNTYKGCSRSGCKWKHACTICASTDHTARKCSQAEPLRTAS
jgi:hypothetical protein